MSGYMGYAATGRAPDPSGMQPVNTESGWHQWILFAGNILVLIGCFHVIQGFVALFRDEVYAVGRTGLVVNVDYTAWGWAQLIIGAVAIITGIFLIRGLLWARILAVVVAFASALFNVAFLSASPVWCALMIAMNIVIIWAVTVHGSEMKEAELA
jgi:hypothetical protein